MMTSIYAFFLRASDELRSANILLKNKQRADAVSLAYYARLHAASGLLARDGIRCKNHLGTIFLLQALYNIDEGFEHAKEERESMQYDPEAFITERMAHAAVAAAENFVSLLFSRKPDAKEKLKQVLRTP